MIFQLPSQELELGPHAPVEEERPDLGHDTAEQGGVDPLLDGDVACHREGEDASELRAEFGRERRRRDHHGPGPPGALVRELLEAARDGAELVEAAAIDEESSEVRHRRSELERDRQAPDHPLALLPVEGGVEEDIAQIVRRFERAPEATERGGVAIDLGRIPGDLEKGSGVAAGDGRDQGLTCRLPPWSGGARAAAVWPSTHQSGRALLAWAARSRQVMDFSEDPAARLRRAQ